MKLYRYTKYCNNETLLNEYNKSNVKIRVSEYEVIRNTPKGYVIRVNYKEKWVPNDTKKRFAYPTKEEALTNFIKRTQRSIWIMKHNILFAKLALSESETLSPHLKN